ncbi:MAG: 23S rRNA (guanosine(2251)-2'-O)-methyltransferase RlmB [Propionibacteriaceae bacterium]|nr:23S rRNA (guanosine(2251)-2'-O)-methyltransferase RlmB [Propionibacteriaceae bacterium]
MAGNSARRGARQRGKGIGSKGHTAGSGGRVRRGLEGRGPTPKAEDRVWHKAYRGDSTGPGLDDSSRGSGRTAAARPGAGAGRTRPSGSSGARGASGQGRPSGSGARSKTADWVVGRNPVWEALQAGLPVKAAYVIEGAQRDDRLRDIFKLTATGGLALLEVSRSELDRLTDGAVHQGVALRLPPFDYADPADVLADALASDGLVVACDQITDPHNLGAIVRSAAAFGAVGVVIPERRSAQLTAAAWKASAGAAAHIPVAKATNLNRCLTDAAAAGCLVLGLAGEAETDLAELDDLTGPIVLVVGSEGAGLSHLVRQHCDVLVRIPLSGPVESLNASVAAGVALYELASRH